MNICPKIDQNLGGLKLLAEHVDNKVELQLLDYDLVEISKAINSLKQTCPKLKEIVIHMAEPLLYIDSFKSLAQDEPDLFVKFIAMLRELSEKLKLSFSLLFHCGWSEGRLTNEELINILSELSDTMSKFNVSILLENTIDDFGDLISYDRCGLIAKSVDKQNLGVCIDTSHLMAIINKNRFTRNTFLMYYRCVRPETVKHIHFSNVDDGDGFNDMSTHGTSHLSRTEVIDTLELLDELRIDYNNTALVPEVMEPSNDYSDRTSQLKEIELLKDVFNNKPIKILKRM